MKGYYLGSAYMNNRLVRVWVSFCFSGCLTICHMCLQLILIHFADNTILLHRWWEYIIQDFQIPPSCRRRQWHPIPALLPGKSHGRRSLVGCSPWGLEESDTAERLHFHFSLSCVGEGNGNPLQCSCLKTQGRGSLVGCCLWGCTESDTTEVT